MRTLPLCLVLLAAVAFLCPQQAVALEMELGAPDTAGQGSGSAAPVASVEPVWLQQSGQLLLVVTPDWQSPVGRLQRFERVPRTPEGKWRPAGEPLEVSVGKNGLGWGVGLHAPEAHDAGGPAKQEGDGKAPAGAFSLPYAFAYDPMQLAGASMSVLDVEPGVLCVDDPDSERYNAMVNAPKTGKAPWSSAETMQREDGLYRLGVVVAHNLETPAAGRGSCIFLHIARRAGAPTAGCTAMEAGKLQELIHWLEPEKKPVLVQLPQGAYERLQTEWGLP